MLKISIYTFIVIIDVSSSRTIIPVSQNAASIVSDGRLGSKMCRTDLCCLFGVFRGVLSVFGSMLGQVIVPPYETTFSQLIAESQFTPKGGKNGCLNRARIPEANGRTIARILLEC